MHGYREAHHGVSLVVDLLLGSAGATLYLLLDFGGDTAGV